MKDSRLVTKAVYSCSLGKVQSELFNRKEQSNVPFLMPYPSHQELHLHPSFGTVQIKLL